MRAVVVSPGKKGSARLAQRDPPGRQAAHCLVRILQCGIDGTDREINDGLYGEAPPNEKALVLGHEALGIVENAVEPLHEGDLVVPTVRRPCSEQCLNCREGEFDFCRSGHFTERGIKGRHGYLSDVISEEPAFLVPVPAHLRAVAVLLEPLSIVEKAFRELYAIQERMQWKPQRVLITGSGSIGLLAAFLSSLRGLETTLYSRGAPSGAEAALIALLELRYVDASDTSLVDAVKQCGAPDIAIEATGYSPLAWQIADALDINGIACLLSVTAGRRSAEIPSDRLNTELVLGNKVIFGSVNSHRRDFERGIADLAAIDARWPGAPARLITRRLPLERIREALDEDPVGDIKTIIEIAGGE